jgi:hypothetical protein
MNLDRGIDLSPVRKLVFFLRAKISFLFAGCSTRYNNSAAGTIQDTTGINELFN